MFFAELLCALRSPTGKIHIARQDSCQREERRLVDPALAMTLITGHELAVWRCKIVPTDAHSLFTKGAIHELSKSRAIAIDTPMPPPAWALMEWELIRAQTRGCTEFFAKYFDERGYLECIPRWGGNDGPDDAIENLVHWPVLYVLGGGAHLYDMCQLAWEGHLKQYTEAKTTEVPFTRDGCTIANFQ